MAMRFIMRLIGTWLLGGALVLIIIDGTKSLAANELVLSSLSDAWALLHEQSLTDAVAWAEANGFAAAWAVLRDTLFSWPGFVVLGVPGLLLAVSGRSRTSRERYIDRI